MRWSTSARSEANVQVTQDDLRSYYNQHRDQYRVPEQVKVSHILIKTPLAGPDGKVDEKGVAEAQHRAEDLLKQLKGGAKFEDLAKKYSEDPGSAKEGGSLGWIGKGRTVPEFEKAAFSLPKGQISDLVKSSYGFHIIRVDDKQDAHMKTLDEVKSRDRAHSEAPESAATGAEAGGDVVDEAKAEGLDAAAASRTFRSITSDFFARKDMLPGLGPAPQFMDAVFAATEKSPPDTSRRLRRVSPCFSCLGSSQLRRRHSKRSAARWKINSRASARDVCSRRRPRNFPTAPRLSTT